MPKLPTLSPRKLARKLARLGFIKDHVTGSHYVYYHPRKKKRAVVPFHLKDVKPGTLSAVLREAGISREEFLTA